MRAAGAGCCWASLASLSSVIGKAGAGSSWSRQRWAGSAATHLAAAAEADAGGRSMVRTAALEMELDHETGGLEGLVLAGHSEGRTLGKMNEAELVALYRELGGDFESRQLLEAYLDSRFPVWRQNAKADNGNGHGRRARFWRHD